MFYGKHEHSIDAKGRMRVPSQFKKELAGGYVFFAPTNEVVSIYPKEEMDKKLEFVKKLSPFNKKEVKIARQVYENIYDVTEDAQGRILIPTEVRDKLRKIESVDENGNTIFIEITVKDLVSIGMNDHIDIMSKQAADKQAEEDLDETLMQSLDELFKRSNGI